MSGNILVQNATMILPSSEAIGDLRVRAGIIDKIAPGGGLEPSSDETVIDASDYTFCLARLIPTFTLETLVSQRRRIWSLAAEQQHLEESHHF